MTVPYCFHCGKNWDPRQGNEACPFCGAAFQEPNPSVENATEALRVIAARHGLSALRESRLTGLMGDYAPDMIRDQNLVRFGMESGAFERLFRVRDSSEEEHSRAAEAGIRNLREYYCMEEQWARAVLTWYWDALQWAIREQIPYRLPERQVDYPDQDESKEPEPVPDRNTDPETPRIPEERPQNDAEDQILEEAPQDGAVLQIPQGQTEIAQEAYLGSSIQGIQIPGSVRRIGNAAFRNCWSLEMVNLQEGLEIIGEDAFQYCVSLAQITLPSSLRQLGKGAFRGCRQLTELEIPEHVAVLPPDLLSGCSGLTRIILPHNIRVSSDFIGGRTKPLEICYRYGKANLSGSLENGLSNPWLYIANEVSVGSIVRGTIVSLTKTNITLELTSGILAELPVQNLPPGTGRRPNGTQDLRFQFSIGDQMDAKVADIFPERELIQLASRNKITGKRH